jgi:autotransporter family porin
MNRVLALHLVPIFLLPLVTVVRGDHVLVADGAAQNLSSDGKTYSTSTELPAMLAIRGGTIFSIADRIAVFPPGGVTALQAQGIGSQITAQNPSITALRLGQTGISGARGVDGGLVALDGGKIEIAGDRSFGLIGDNGTVIAKGALTISMTGVDSHGIEARRTGLVELNPNTTITTSGEGGFGIFALSGGTVTANGIAITTSGFLSPTGFDADGAAALGGTIHLENSSIRTSGDNANGLHVLDADSKIFGTNLAIVTSGRAAAGAEADNGGSIQLNGGSITTAGVDADGALARRIGTVILNPGVVINTTGNGSFGLFAVSGGSIVGSGASVTTSGGLGDLLNAPDGAAALGGTIHLENSSIRTSGDNANGLHVLDANSKIFGTNLAVVTSGRAAAGAEADNGGSIQLNGGSITTAGVDAAGALAQRGGTITLNPGIVMNTSGNGSYGLFALSGGSIIGNGASVTTSGGLGALLNTADGAVALTGPSGPGTITLQNSTISANGPGANGLFVSGPGSSIALTNSNVLSSKGSGALVDNSASLTLTSSSLTALVHGIVVTRGTAAAPNSIIVSGGNLITVFGDAFQVRNGVTNIAVNNGATVTGNSALLRVLDPPLDTVVNFNASHASLFGDIFADPASQTTVNLTNSTVLTGKVNPPPIGSGVDMTIDGSSQWVMTGSSDVKSLSVSPGANALFRPPFIGVHSTLTIGSLLGTGGTFGMNIDLRHALGDLIDITGTSAGSHLLTFFDRGHGTDLRPNESLLVVKTSDGVAGFSGMTDRAVYKYFVVHGDGSPTTPVPDDWYLVRADKIVRDQVTRLANAPAGSVNTPVGLSPVDALSNAANAAIGTYAAGIPLFYADMDTLIQRLGELRFSTGENSAPLDSNGKAITPSVPPEEAPSTIGTWVRGFGSGMHINDQVSRAYDQTTGGFQLGADKRFNALHGDLYIGGFLSYFNASRDFLDGGNGSTNALSLGAYATWIHPKGWYADLVLKYTQLWNYFNTPASDGSSSTANFSIPSLGGSLEVGKRFDVGKFFIEPQAQLAGVWEAGDNYTASNGLMVGESDQFSLRGRLGLRAGMHLALNNGIEIEPYLKVSAIHEFLTGDRITANENGFNPTLSGTLVDAAAGITARVSRSVYLYGEYDYANGDKIRQPWAVNLGARWLWGGKQEKAEAAEQRSLKQSVGKQAEEKVIEQPPAKTTEPWQISVAGPGWLTDVSGFTGFHGVNPYVNVGVGQLLRHVNVVFASEAEVRKGRYGALGDVLYLNAQAGVSGTGLVSRVGLGLQQFGGEFFGSYRVIEGPHGWFDLLAGFRYTYLGEQTGLNANEQAINVASTNLVDQFAQQLATPSSDLRALIQKNILNRLTSLNGRNPPLPVGPIFGGQPGIIRDLVQQLIDSRQPELAAAIRTGAQARVNQLKAQLASQVANKLTSQLNRSLSFYDDWFDPVIGVRGRLNLSKAFYLTAETDVGGFGIGSDIAWQGYAALGCQITRNIYSEVGYRALYDDFRDEGADGFLYQLWLHGVQITAGLKF